MIDTGGEEGHTSARPTETDDLGPYLALAREIRAEVERVIADDEVTLESAADLIERYPDVERERVVREVFDRLDPLDQWEILARTFDDAALRRYLADRHDAASGAVERAAEHQARLEACRRAGAIDVRSLPTGTVLSLGLFRETEVAAAVRRGRVVAGAARRLVVRVTEDGWCRVVEDVFDPDHSYFLTTEYDPAAWHTERLESHARVQVGALLTDGDDGSFEPVLVPGARVDVRTDAGASRGRLHLGFAMLAGDDVFGD